MIIISHRGKLNGSSFSKENTINTIDYTLSKGIHVEVDVWGDNNNQLAIGHDNPDEYTSIDYLSNSRIWVHAKNNYALEILYKTDVNYFYHQDDAFTVTSKGYNWAHIDTTPLISNTVYCAFSLNQLEKLKSKGSQPIGVCTDFPLAALDIFNA